MRVNIEKSEMIMTAYFDQIYQFYYWHTTDWHAAFWHTTFWIGQ
jgi:hypothetical protein